MPGKGKRLIIANGAYAEVNQGIVELIKEAFAIRNQLLSGSDDSIEAMSARIGMNKFPPHFACSAPLSRSRHHSRSSCGPASHRAHADPAFAAEQRPAARLAGT